MFDCDTGTVADRQSDSRYVLLTRILIETLIGKDDLDFDRY